LKIVDMPLIHGLMAVVLPWNWAYKKLL